MRPEHVAFFRAAFLRHGPRRYAVMQPENADRKYDDFTGSLTDTHITAHLAGRAAYAVPYGEAGLGSVLAFDIDAGGLTTATELLDAASARGLWAFGQVDTARGRGYVWVPFNDLVNIERLRILGDQLINEATRPGIQASGWKIENRASEADTRLPFARHRWTGQRGILILQNGQLADLDQDERLSGILDRFAVHYRENPTDTLPPPPAPRERPQARPAAPQEPGITIASYNAATDLVQLLDHYGAKRARGQGARLYFCPFHSDDHASLLVSRDGSTCRCMSEGSGCTLSGHQNDAFNVYCAGEQLTSAQALRRLNGHPDTPGPRTGGGGSPSHRTPRQSHREAPRSSESGQGAPVTPAQPQNTPQEPPEATGELPKSARRVLAYLRQQPGDYCRGKAHLAEALDIDPRTVQRSLRRLEAEGHITRYQRGRDGQTDIYRIARRCVSYDTQARQKQGATNRVSAVEKPQPQSQPEAEQPQAEQERTRGQGGQMPPTGILESLPATESLGAVRGGNPPEPQLDPATGAYHGPAGAFVYPGGAAWVPPEAAAWYATLPPEALGVAMTPPPHEPDPEPVQAALAEQPTPQAEQPARRRRRTTKQPAYVDPGRLQGRIIAAERKAAKLERGSANERRQASAIRREAERLKIKLEMMQERYYSTEEAEQWQPVENDGPESAQAPHTPRRATPESLPAGLDWSYLERLYQAGERRGIETHCTLNRVDVGQVLGRLAAP